MTPTFLIKGSLRNDLSCSGVLLWVGRAASSSVFPTLSSVTIFCWYLQNSLVGSDCTLEIGKWYNWDFFFPPGKPGCWKFNKYHCLKAWLNPRVTCSVPQSEGWKMLSLPWSWTSAFAVGGFLLRGRKKGGLYL